MSREDVRRYYAALGEREWERLEQIPDGIVEFAVNCDAIARRVPPASRVLDIGGGPGRYTVWSAQQGHRVVLADLSHEQLEIARSRVRVADVHDLVEEIVEADVCDLSRWPDGSFDAVLCLGPFYHLPDAADRVLAAREVARVLSPGALTFIALMPRYSLLRRALALPDERRQAADPEFRRRLLDEGTFINEVPGRFTRGYGVRVEEVEPFFERHGFESLELLSSEGASVGLSALAPDLLHDPELRAAISDLARDTARDRSILGLAGHLLYVGRKR